MTTVCETSDAGPVKSLTFQGKGSIDPVLLAGELQQMDGREWTCTAIKVQSWVDRLEHTATVAGLSIGALVVLVLIGSGIVKLVGGRK